MAVFTIDARLLGYPRWSGVEHYTWNVIREMQRLAPEVAFRLLFDSAPTGEALKLLLDAPNTKAICHRGSVRFYGRLPFELALSRSRVYYAMGGRLPPFPLPCKSVLTVHDLMPLTRPEFLPTEEAQSLAKKWRTAVPRADRIVTVSGATRAELVTSLGYDPSRIFLAPPAVVPRPAGQRPAWLPDRRYVLMVNPGRPNKNWHNALAAFAKFRAEAGDGAPALLLAGALSSQEQPIRRMLEESQLNDDVVLGGYVSDAELGWLYENAFAALFPSWYEGFGMPALEALHYKLPLIASNIPSIREIVEDAGILVDPASVDEIKLALLRVFGSNAARDTLIRRAAERAAAYSWEASARSTLKVLEQV
jgi:glycosyltransferase involved in cell wall biosynthesis